MSETHQPSGDPAAPTLSGATRPAELPSAPRREHVREAHGHRVEDPYAWMADREDPELRAYLEAENAHAERVTAHVTPLADAIFGEIKARTRETDLSVPVAHGDWWYYSRTVEGLQYPIEARVSRADHPERPSLDGGGAPTGEQVLLDVNAEAEGLEFLDVGSSETSPDGRLLAYAVDTRGDERFALRVKDVDPASPRCGEVVDDAVTDIGYGLAFSLTGSHVFYTRVDDAWRPFQVWRHEVGAPSGADVLVYEEPDPRFTVGVGASRDDRHILVGSASRTTCEWSILDAATPTAEPRVVAPRQPGLEYEVEPAGDHLLVIHNRDRVNFEVAVAPLDATSSDQWVATGATGEDEYVTGVDAFDTFAAVSLRREGATAVRILERSNAGSGAGTATYAAARDVPVAERVSTIRVGANPDPATRRLRVSYESLVTPRQVLEVDVATGEQEVLKTQEVRGGYDPSEYVSTREWATAPDGARVPVSIVRHRDTPVDGTAACLLHGYGAYGICLDPWFSIMRLSLLQRGVVFAIAHARGGSEMGRSWYDDGKLERKEHTFDDVVAAGEHLVELGYASPDRLGAEGGSAGGLLIGAVANRAPGLFAILHAQVPFVDALTTMLDPDLPLTAGEWEEWGNPLEDEAAYRRMKGYSPYENVAAMAYPTMLVTTNLNDTRVYVTEPAKWVARLREVAVADAERPVIFRTQMRAGHAGDSGRYDRWRQAAWELAVVADALGAG